MDESLKKIERILQEKQIHSKIEALLPQAAKAAKPQEDMGITVYGKGQSVAAAEPAIQTTREYQPPPEREETPAETTADAYTKMAAGGREFSLDELGDNTEVQDPLMGPVLKSSGFRDVSLDDLDRNTIPDENQNKR
jgi:hypothetical protein